MFWYGVDPEILVDGVRHNGEEIPKDNYAMLYAEMDAITGLLFFDMRYLYRGKQSFRISYSNFLIHWITSVVILVLAPFLLIPIIYWLQFSILQVVVVYLYSDLGLRDDGSYETTEEEVDVFY